jgi:hypothetical protein
MEIQDNNGEKSPQSISLNQPTTCENMRDFYGKYQVDKVISNITVEAEYTGSKPDAVDDFHYGITHLTITRLEKSMGGNNSAKILSLKMSILVKLNTHYLIQENKT